jgi:hypothetical protein
MTTTTRYQITSRSGADYGVWEAESPAAALLQMHRDAGIGASRAWLSADGADVEFADDGEERPDATLREMAGGVADWDIAPAERDIHDLIAEDRTMTTTTPINTVYGAVSQYVAYDEQAIWGVGDTPEAALEDARGWIEINRRGEMDAAERAEIAAGMETNLASPALVAAVAAQGGTVPFAVERRAAGHRAIVVLMREQYD